MFQSTQIIGHLGRDCEMRYTPSGQAVTNFSVATTNKYKNKSGEQVSETIWFRVSVWGSMAEACNQYLSKGSLVFVEGTLKADKATGGPNVFTKHNGDVSASFELNASTVKFLSGRNGNDTKKEEEYDEEIPGFMRE